MGERTCSACDTPKSLEDFGVDVSRPEGRSYVCRVCKNQKAKAAYVPRPVPRRGWMVPTRNGDKKQARRRVNYLVEQGRIPRPDDLPCMDCADEVFSGSTRHEYDHAKGYDGDNQLYVEPVCTRCHNNREEARCG